MSPEQTRLLRKQVNPDYLKRPTADPGTPFNSVLSREYYPQFHTKDKQYGTDMEEFLKDFSKAADNKNSPKEDDRISPPDYNDPASRTKFTEEFYKKYPGVGHGRGDTPLRVNETPYGASDTSKNISTKAASKLGLDPALFYNVSSFASQAIA